MVVNGVGTYWAIRGYDWNQGTQLLAEVGVEFVDGVDSIVAALVMWFEIKFIIGIFYLMNYELSYYLIAFFFVIRVFCFVIIINPLIH